MQELIYETQEDVQQQTYVPICGGNYVSPVVDTVTYITEHQYMIGERLHIENAD